MGNRRAVSDKWLSTLFARHGFADELIEQGATPQWQTRAPVLPAKMVSCRAARITPGMLTLAELTRSALRSADLIPRAANAVTLFAGALAAGHLYHHDRHSGRSVSHGAARFFFRISHARVLAQALQTVTNRYDILRTPQGRPATPVQAPLASR